MDAPAKNTVTSSTSLTMSAYAARLLAASFAVLVRREGYSWTSRLSNYAYNPFAEMLILAEGWPRLEGMNAAEEEQSGAERYFPTRWEVCVCGWRSDTEEKDGGFPYR